jgi:hypothetical protein
MNLATAEFLSSSIVTGLLLLLVIVKTVTIFNATNQVTPRKWLYFNHGEIYTNGDKAFQKIFQNRLSVAILIYSILAVVFFVWHYIFFGALW